MERVFHGQSKTRLYKIWKGLRNRCNNPNNRAYRIYGARGITVYEAWQESFLEFQAWALANGYSDNLTIERRDTDGNYTPVNCKWATYKEQANNLRCNVLIEYQGKNQTLSNWADELKLPYSVLKNRHERGWPIERIFTQAIRPTYKKYIKSNGA